MNSLVRLIDGMQIIYMNSEIHGEFKMDKLTETLGDMRCLSPLHALIGAPSFCGHFIAWRMAQFLGPAVSRQYKWFTVVREPVDWAVSIYNFAHQISRDPYHFAFGWDVAPRFGDWIANLEPNPQTGFAPDRRATAAMDYARFLNMDVIPLPKINEYIDILYNDYGAPALPANHDNKSIPRLHKDDLSKHERDLIHARLAEDALLYDLAVERFSMPTRVRAAPSAEVVAPRTTADFAGLARTGPVFIYGSTVPGRLVLRALQETPQVDFAGFLDSTKEGTVGRYPVFRADEVLVGLPGNATVIVAAQAYGPVARRLVDAGVKRIWDGYPYAASLMNSRPRVR
ncbi:hypothetical protein [Azospirillum sp. ST 5-10]|uniref:hypothetical protein n=1 Tax=unclassified Azospirillum TaxID=2630922 RepID=UPI003F49C846